jgi:hypothetical protein
MQQKQLDLQKKYFEEQKKLQAAAMAEERKYAKEQYELQKKQLALAEEQAKAAHEHEEAVFAMQLYLQLVNGEMNTLTGEGMQMLHNALVLIKQDIIDIYEIAQNPPEIAPIPAEMERGGGPVETFAQNHPYNEWNTVGGGGGGGRERQTEVTYAFRTANQQKPQNIHIYIGNEHLAKFVVDTVSEELRT